MNRMLLSVAAIGLTLSLTVSAAIAADLDKIYNAVDKVVVVVEYRAEMTFMGQSDDIEGRVMGIITGPDGLVIFDGTTLGTGSDGGDSFMNPRVDEPSLLKITDYKDREFEAEFIGVDRFSSIAFCRLPDSALDILKPAHFEDTDISLGEEIYVFWMLPESYQPRFQMTSTVITNVLEKPEKYFLTGELTQDFLMSPVVSKRGKMLGIITPLQMSASRGDFASTFGIPVGVMPLDRFKEMLSKPPSSDEYKRGWLGISLQALDPEVAEFWDVDVSGGIIVTEILPNTPADKAGLKQGDFITVLDDQPLDLKEDAHLSVFQKKISEKGAGADIKLTVLRPDDEDIDTLEFAITLGEVPIAASEAPSFEDKNFDLTVRDLVFADYNANDLDPDEIKGVMADKMEPGGWAAVGGIRPGDIITKINGGKVTSVDEAKTILAEIELDKGKEVVFMVWRRNKTQFVNVKTHWK